MKRSMKRKLTGQEILELRTSKSMSPEQRLNWLAMALEFAREVERSNPPKKKNARQ